MIESRFRGRVANDRQELWRIEDGHVTALVKRQQTLACSAMLKSSEELIKRSLKSLDALSELIYSLTPDLIYDGAVEAILIHLNPNNLSSRSNKALCEFAFFAELSLKGIVNLAEILGDAQFDRKKTILFQSCPGILRWLLYFDRTFPDNHSISLLILRFIF